MKNKLIHNCNTNITKRIDFNIKMLKIMSINIFFIHDVRITLFQNF